MLHEMKDANLNELLRRCMKFTYENPNENIFVSLKIIYRVSISTIYLIAQWEIINNNIENKIIKNMIRRNGI